MKPRQLRYPPRKCESCGRQVPFDLGCNHCATLARYWHQAELDDQSRSREQSILIGALVAGMNEAFVRRHALGREPTQKAFEAAVDAACQYVKSFGYVLGTGARMEG